MDQLLCRLEPFDTNIRGTYLPDGEEVIIGRSAESNVQSIHCSRQQLSLVADYRDQIVGVTVCGRSDSVVDGRVLLFGESCFAGHGSVIELVKGSFKYRVIFTECRKRCDLSNDKPSKKKHDKVGKTEKMDTIEKVDKPTEIFSWDHLYGGEVLFGCHQDYELYRRKVASFDLDGTLIKTLSGNTFPKDAKDWTFWHDSVKDTLKEFHNNGFQIAIFTNQASLSMPKGKMLLKDFKKKVESIILCLGVPACVYISITDGYYRKPAPGMWDLMKSRITSKAPAVKINTSESFYVGDAAGRCADWKPGKKADFAASDRLFSINTQLKFYTPEEFFLKEPPVQYPEIAFAPNKYEDGSLTDPDYFFPTDEKEVILMIGSPASGKSHFVKTHLTPKKYEIVSRDNLGSWQRCINALKKFLEAGKNVVIDNTNPDVASRQRFIEVCKEMNVKVRCFQMTTILERCLHNNKYRQITDSSHATIKSHLIRNFHSSFEPPTLEEGFSEIVKVPFVPLFKNLDYERIYNYYLVA